MRTKIVTDNSMTGRRVETTHASNGLLENKINSI
jgi:hypothetical protein